MKGRSEMCGKGKRWERDVWKRQERDVWKRQKVGARCVEKAGARCVEKAGVRCVEKAKVGARYVEKRRGWSDNGTHLFVRVHGSVGEEGVVLDLAHGLVAVGSTAAAQSELWVSVDHLSVDGWAESGLHTILYYMVYYIIYPQYMCR